jgi:predicted nucleic acid-binding protein
VHYRQTEHGLYACKTAIRALDALHIACSWSFRASLVTCDTLMHEAAQMLGLKSIFIGS